MSDRIPVRRALLGVYDKSGVEDLARGLAAAGVELVSTGATAARIAEAGIPVTPVEQVTGFPECLDGRVKTLHPAIHGGLLARRDEPSHMQTLAEHGIGGIDLVVNNLYPFETTVAQALREPQGERQDLLNAEAVLPGIAQQTQKLFFCELVHLHPLGEIAVHRKWRPYVRVTSVGP